MKKNSFTSTELKTLHNTKFFEVKAAATKKIDVLFADVRDVLKKEIERKELTFPQEVDAVNGKIFRGENYNGLPYLVLDYPKHFSKTSVLAFRTMFWWGNFFSFTLHVQGKALEEWRRKKAPLLLSPEGRKLFSEKGIYICVNDTPWEYHYQKDNYLPIKNISDTALKKMILKKDFIKLSARMPVKRYKELNTFCKEAFGLMA